jgi:hypothetical protein
MTNGYRSANSALSVLGMTIFPRAEADLRYEQARERLCSLTDTDPKVSSSICRQLNLLVQTLITETSAASQSLRQERFYLEQRTQNFQVEESAPYRYFAQRDWASASFKELQSIASVIAQTAGIPLDRESKRRKPLLFKWLDEHWAQLKPVADATEADFVFT